MAENSPMKAIATSEETKHHDEIPAATIGGCDVKGTSLCAALNSSGLMRCEVSRRLTFVESNKDMKKKKKKKNPYTGHHIDWWEQNFLRHSWELLKDQHDHFTLSMDLFHRLVPTVNRAIMQCLVGNVIHGLRKLDITAFISRLLALEQLEEPTIHVSKLSLPSLPGPFQELREMKFYTDFYTQDLIPLPAHRQVVLINPNAYGVCPYDDTLALYVRVL